MSPTSAPLLLLLPCFVGTASDAVPPPAKTPAGVIVSGRTSTLREVATVAVGQAIPRTFSGDRVKNTPGFSWYVSQHYAFKTDYPEKTARSYLELLELAYPQYVELFGKEPPGLDEKRMAVVYASSGEQLRKALQSDGITWSFRGGGITFEGYFCAYQYPSGTLQYHQRYIVLHECAHLFQMCLNGTMGTTPAWYLEGVADSLGHHVYDPATRRLTVHVIDKATITNYLDDGLASQRRKQISLQEVHKAGGAGRDVMFLLMHFFMDDPDRLQKLRIWRDEMFRLKQHGKEQTELSARLLQELFGPWPRLEADFWNWLAGRRNTFHYVEWGWEQDGSTLWSYGFANDGKLSQTDVLLPPGEKAIYDPLRMDYPAEPVPEIVGPVQRGGPEPVVGAVIDFSPHPGRGRAGIGLGVVHEAQIKPFDASALFFDKDGKEPGVRVTVREWAGDKPGELIGESVDAMVALDEKGSITRLAGKNFAVDWQAWLRIDKAGEHTFGVNGNPGSRLWLDDGLVLERGDHRGPLATTANVKVTAGLHRIRLRHIHRDGPRALTVGFASTGGPPGCVQLLIQASRQLALDGSALGLERRVVELPDDLKKAMAAGGHRVGLTARIAPKALEVTLRARDPQAAMAITFRESLALDDVSRRRLLERPGTLLARDGYHRLTPFFDDARRLEPALSKPAPANRWRNPGDAQLAGVYRAAWRLGERSPKALLMLREQMRQAADKSPDLQNEALASYRHAIGRLKEEVRKCAASAKTIEQALAELRE